MVDKIRKRRGNYTAAQFIAAIPGSGGIVTTIAKRVGCAWHTARKYIEKHPTVTQAYADECESITDLAETTVIKAIKEGDQHTAKWYLTMKGRKRGYAPTVKQDIEVKGSVSVSDERIQQALEILHTGRTDSDSGGN